MILVLSGEVFSEHLVAKMTSFYFELTKLLTPRIEGHENNHIKSTIYFLEVAEETQKN